MLNINSVSYYVIIMVIIKIIVIILMWLDKGYFQFLFKVETKNSLPIDIIAKTFMCGERMIIKKFVLITITLRNIKS